MQVTVDGLKIEYTDTGSGIPLLLLHGWGSSSAVYAGVIAALSDRCRCVAPDFPGCGGSETMKTPWTIDDYCTFVLHFMAAVGLDQPILCGHSHGGRVIMKLAGSGLLHPPKIVFLDAAGLIPVKTPRQKRRAKEFKTIKKMLTLPVRKGAAALRLGGLQCRARSTAQNNGVAGEYRFAGIVAEHLLSDLVDLGRKRYGNAVVRRKNY